MSVSEFVRMVNHCDRNGLRMNPSSLNEHHLATVLNAAPVAMVVCDASSRIVFANQQASVTFGYSVDQLCSMDVSQLIPSRLQERHHERVRTFFSGPNPRVMGVGSEVVGIHSSGHEIPLEIGLTPFQTSHGPLAIAAVLDISERKRREADSTLAQLVQRAMLPIRAPAVAGLDIAAESESADAAGGDFYDYIPLGDGKLAVVIGDASGHGFAAALVTVAARSYLRAYSSVDADLSTILGQTNAQLLHDGLDGRFVTLFYAVLDIQRKSLRFAGAGHMAYLFSADGTLKETLASTGPPLGWFPEAEYPCDELPIVPGDILLMLTDGIEEAMAASGEQFGRQRLLEFLRQNVAEPSVEITRRLHQLVHEFQGDAGQHDDATVIVVRFTPE